MSVDAAHAKLQQIPVDKIEANPENPRLVFRSGELDELLESIRLYGVQVPIAVFRDGNKFILIDGERRWRCALKLNHKTIPALVQKRPSVLQNLLLMFNIHALREQWDLLTIALKLPRIVELLSIELDRSPTEREISDRSGLKRGVIRRCKLLMNLPERYKQQILAELERPKSKQKFTEDLFIEMERALTTVERSMPELIPNRDAVRKVLLKKFRNGVIGNRVLFRDVARMARAEKVGGDVSLAANELKKLFDDNNYSIEQAYQESVGVLYTERDIGTKVSALLGLLEGVDEDELDDEVRGNLEVLLNRITSILQEDK